MAMVQRPTPRKSTVRNVNKSHCFGIPDTKATRKTPRRQHNSIAASGIPPLNGVTDPNGYVGPPPAKPSGISEKSRPARKPPKFPKSTASASIFFGVSDPAVLCMMAGRNPDSETQQYLPYPVLKQRLKVNRRPARGGKRVPDLLSFSRGSLRENYPGSRLKSTPTQKALFGAMPVTSRLDAPHIGVLDDDRRNHAPDG